MAKKISSTPQAQQTTPVHSHEKMDISFKLLLFVLGLIFVTAFIIHGVLWGWISGKSRGTHQRFAGEWRVIMRSAAGNGELPALQVNPQRDLVEYQREQQARLASYGWVDPKAGTIQLPIERAMQIISEQGLPKWQATTARFDPPGTAAHSGTNIDAAFLKKMAQASKGTIEFGQQAKGKAQTSQLSNLGKKLVQEHQKLLQKIEKTAKDGNIPLPQAPDLNDQVVLHQLQHKQGSNFDTTIARQLLVDNARTLRVLEEATNQLQKTEIKKLASHLHDKLETDMQDVREAAKSVGISEGTILSIIQRQKQAVQITAISPQEEQYEMAHEEPPGAPYAEQPIPGPGGAYPSGPPESKTNQPSAHVPQAELNVDAAFVRHLAQSSAADQQLGKLGARQAHGQLADLSHKLTEDHSKLEPKLESAAQNLEITLPEEPGLLDQLALKQLQQEHGTNFDQALAHRILSDDAKLLQEIQNATNSLQNQKVKQLASETISNLQQRLGESKSAALAAGVKPGNVESIVATQLMAAGAPYPLMAGAETSTNQTQAGREAAAGKQSSAQGAAGKSSGRQSGGGSSQTNAPGQSETNKQARPATQGTNAPQETNAIPGTNTPSNTNAAQTNSNQGTNSTQNTNSAPGTNVEQSGGGPSPLQLQQQRAKHPK